MGNPRLGFVCTKQTVDLQDSLEGYFFEYDRDLAPEERLRFTRDEEAPLFDPAKAPQLDPTLWPEERREKAHRNYAMEYVRNALPMLIELFGADDARQLGSAAAYLIGLQFFAESKAALGIARSGIAGFIDFFAAMAKAQDEDATIGGDTIRQRGWRLMRGIEPLDNAAFAIWNALWEGCLAAHDRTLRWTPQPTADADVFVWKISRR
jgi:hypothetical protein